MLDLFAILACLLLRLANGIARLFGGEPILSASSRILPSGSFNDWMDQKGLRRSTVTYEFYDDPALQRQEGACVIVGAGTRGNTPIGFAIEFDRYDGVIASQLIQSEHSFGWYRRFAAEAHQTRRSLMDTIGDRAHKLYD